MLQTLKHKIYSRASRTFRALLEYGKPYQSFLYNGKYVEGKVDTVRMYYSLGLSSKIQNKSWLDLGCNEGSICLSAAKDHASEVTGVDIEEKYLASGRKRAEEAHLKVSFIGKNIVDFIEQSDRYDVITMFAMARHIYRSFVQQKGYVLPKTGRAHLVYNSYETLILGTDNPVREQMNQFFQTCISKANDYFILSINDHSGQILRNSSITEKYFRGLSDRIDGIEIFNFSPQNPEYVIIKLSLRSSLQ